MISKLLINDKGENSNFIIEKTGRPTLINKVDNN